MSCPLNLTLDAEVKLQIMMGLTQGNRLLLLQNENVILIFKIEMQFLASLT